MAKPRKPQELKVLEGTYRKDRDNLDSPRGTKGAPVAPDYLDPLAKQAWFYIADEMSRLNTLTTSDGFILELICTTYARMRRAQIALEKYGSSTYMSAGAGGKGFIIKPYPEVNEVSDCTKILGGLLSKVGMTPSDRTRVSMVETKDDNNPFGIF